MAGVWPARHPTIYHHDTCKAHCQIHKNKIDCPLKQILYECVYKQRCCWECEIVWNYRSTSPPSFVRHVNKPANWRQTHVLNNTNILTKYQSLKVNRNIRAIYTNKKVLQRGTHAKDKSYTQAETEHAHSKHTKQITLQKEPETHGWTDNVEVDPLLRNSLDTTLTGTNAPTSTSSVETFSTTYIVKIKGFHSTSRTNT